jgi:hypothetical protein
MSAPKEENILKNQLIPYARAFFTTFENSAFQYQAKYKKNL